MAVQLHNYLITCLFCVAISTLLYVSWTDIIGTLRFLPHTHVAVPLWDTPFTVSSTNESRTSTEPPDLTPIPVLQLKDYKKLPQWDFDDRYERDKSPSKSTQNCEASLWNIINQDPELRKLFIPNVRMYVHNGSITMSEWNRLSHFNNPFGFMNYSHQDVVPALSLIPRLKVPLLTPKVGRDCISCAVVGAGGVLWKSGKGHEIDSHDYVFRVNGALIKGFEDDVGNRTDIYVHTAHSITSSEILFGKYKYSRAPHDEDIKYVLIPEGLRDFRWLTALYKTEMIPRGQYRGRHPWYQYSGHFNATRFYVLHMDFLRYVRNRFLKSPHLNGTLWRIVRPTNGAFTMFLALHVCDRVDAYGFITEDHKKYSNYYFERGAKTRVIFYANHDYDMEMKLWKKLHELKIINLYRGEGRQTEPTTPAQNKTLNVTQQNSTAPKQT